MERVAKEGAGWIKTLIAKKAWLREVIKQVVGVVV